MIILFLWKSILKKLLLVWFSRSWKLWTQNYTQSMLIFVMLEQDVSPWKDSNPKWTNLRNFWKFVCSKRSNSKCIYYLTKVLLALLKKVLVNLFADYFSEMYSNKFCTMSDDLYFINLYLSTFKKSISDIYIIWYNFTSSAMRLVPVIRTLVWSRSVLFSYLYSPDSF